MFNKSQRKALALAAVLALTAPMYVFAIPYGDIDGENVLVTRDGGVYHQPDSNNLSLAGVHAYEGGTVVLHNVSVDGIVPNNTSGFLDNQDSTIYVDGGDIFMRRQPGNTLSHTRNGVTNIGIDEQGNHTTIDKRLSGDIMVGGRVTPLENNNKHSEINIVLNTPNSSWNGMAYNASYGEADQTGAINLDISNGAVWRNEQLSSNPRGLAGHDIDDASRIHRLIGTSAQDYTTGILQDDSSHHSMGSGVPIYIDQMQGHMNIYMASNGLRAPQSASDFPRGNVYIQSATPGSAVHMMTAPYNIDTNNTQEVETVLNALANKVYYTNYVTGERNLSGTVAIASRDNQPSLFKLVSANGKNLEGDIEWQADKNGQGRYAPGTLGRSDTANNNSNNGNTTNNGNHGTNNNSNNTNNGNNSANNNTNNGGANNGSNNNSGNNANNNGGNNGIYRGDADTLHMRGVRSAVYSNIGAWRTLTDSMYRPRALQQGEPTGIWAHVGAGHYDFAGRGVSNESEYTRFQGGFDKKFGTLIVGGQMDYLHGDDDFINHGNGKERAFAVGAYALKNLGDDAYVHVETKVGRVSNEFTVYGELFNTPMQAMDTRTGKVKSTAYSIAARVGKQVKFGNGLYIEPQAQLSYMRLGGDTFTTGAMTVNQSAVNSTAGKIGLEIGKTFGAGSVYTRFDVGHAFTGNVKTQYNNTITETDIKGTWTEIAFGGRYGIGTNNSIYADVSRGLSGDYKQKWGMTAGFTHKF